MRCNIGQLTKKELLISSGIVVLALFVRFFYLYESSANPSFTMPIIDSQNYDNLARLVVTGKGMNHIFFWQPFFYPIFLSVVYLVSNSSIICAKVVQLLLGGATCLLTYHLGRSVFDRRTGVIAGVMTALYGPLVFFELELLASGWAAFWSVVLILLFIKTSSTKNMWLCMVLGTCGALSIITRPTFIPFFTVAVVWLVIVFCRAGHRWRSIGLRLGVILTGFLLIAIPVAGQNFRITGHFGILPGSGSINIHVGNNPNYTKTITARPGFGWEELVELPTRNGFTGNQWEQGKFFEQKVRDYIFSEPLGFVRGLAHKTIQFLNSREIPRNVDVYLFGKWSRLLGLLTWKVGGFGFPFGLLLPLTLLGAAGCWRRIPVPLLLFVILYPLSIVLVFVASRYRVAIIPVMSVIAAAGVLNLIRIVRGLHWRRLVIICVFGVGIVLLSTLPGPFPEEQYNFEAEFYLSLATAENDKGKNKEAIEHSLEALRLKPDLAGVHTTLGHAFKALGKLDDALSHHRQALKNNPSNFKMHNNLASLLVLMDKLDEAINHYRQALQIEPDHDRLHYNLGVAFQLQGKLDEAIDHYTRAIRLDPTSALSHQKLASALTESGRNAEAITHFRQALEIEPDDAIAHNDLACMLASQGRFDEAISHCRESLRIAPDIAETHNNLGGALVRQSKSDEAIKHFRKALQLDPDNFAAHHNLGNTIALQGNLEEAAAHLAQAIRLNPNSASAHYNLARLLNDSGKTDAAVMHFIEALRIRPDWVKPMRRLARLLATHGQDKLHDPTETVRLAQRACKLTDYKDAGLVDSLAAAYAAAGRFSEAVATAEKAIELADAGNDKQRAKRIRNRLKLYRKEKPYQQP
jgi:tetratricopeptide (TPR) repeat protein